MSVLALMNVSCRILSRTADYGTTDDYGNPTFEVVPVAVSGCEIQQSASSEDHDDDVQTSVFRVFLPPDVPVRGWDAIELTETGERFELDGDAWMVRNPRTGLLSHVEGIVRRVE